MATVNIVRSKVINNSVSQRNMPVLDSAILNTETITSSASSQASTDVGALDDNEYWSISVSGNNIWVKFGTAPTASAENDILIIDGQTREFSTVVGEKIAVIDA